MITDFLCSFVHSYTYETCSFECLCMWCERERERSFVSVSVRICVYAQAYVYERESLVASLFNWIHLEICRIPHTMERMAFVHHIIIGIIHIVNISNITSADSDSSFDLMVQKLFCHEYTSFLYLSLCAFVQHVQVLHISCTQRMMGRVSLSLSASVSVCVCVFSVILLLLLSVGSTELVVWNTKKKLYSCVCVRMQWDVHCTCALNTYKQRTQTHKAVRMRSFTEARVCMCMWIAFYTQTV